MGCEKNLTYFLFPLWMEEFILTKIPIRVEIKFQEVCCVGNILEDCLGKSILKKKMKS